ncbi:unnamed protein product [marine sediment metagenome]|uniref:Uncharacterized protein n=1 Tax=marine sediment metagenome TaxID=412755 RepID=X1ANM7_9ZZZZ
MKAKTRFMKMFYKLPEDARSELVFDFIANPMTLNVVAIEVRNDTPLGKKILKILGYEDDKNG